jgi:guanylate kinase
MAEAEQRQRGRLIVLAAPSGAGKTTLVHALLARVPDLVFSVSYTTRAPRAGERPGSDYFFVSQQEFTRMVEAGAFLEHARVFDHWYGTGIAHVNDILERGRSVVLAKSKAALRKRALSSFCRRASRSSSADYAGGAQIPRSGSDAASAMRSAT